MTRRSSLFIGLVALVLNGCAQPAAPPAATPPPPSTATPTVPATPAPTPRPPVTPPQPYPGGLSSRWWDEAVFYVVLVRSYYDADADGYGDLQGLIEKLDYLNDGDPGTDTDLGVNGLWLMPVYASPAYHGYAAADYYQIEPHYGDNATFRDLITEAHRRGIHVIVDLALNHTSEKHPWFLDSISSPDAEHRDWYVWAGNDPGWRGPDQRAVWYMRNDAYYYAFFGSALPDLNLQSEAVTVQMHDVARFWLLEMGVDGFRLDAIRHLIEEGQDQESTAATLDWLKRFRASYEPFSPHAMTIGEVTGPTSERLAYYDGQVDLCFEFDWTAAAVESLDKGDPASLLASQAFIYSAYPRGQYGTFLALQDHNRIISQLGDSLPKARLAATLLLTSPGVPFLYYGEEIGMRGRKPDVFIRRPMQWSDELRAGFSIGRPWMDVDLNYDEVNVRTQSAEPDSLLSHYRRLIHLRLQFAALRTGDWLPLDASEDGVYAFLRHAEDGTLMVVLNLGKESLSQVGLTARKSPILPGEYEPQELLALEQVQPLRANCEGAFENYIPLDVLDPHSGYVVLID
jgi:glycosidase